jgi:hypothetical protein
MALDDDLKALLRGVATDTNQGLLTVVQLISARVLRGRAGVSGNGVWVDLLAEARSIEELSVALGALPGKIAAEDVAAREAALLGGVSALRARLAGGLMEVDARQTAALLAVPDGAIRSE